MSPKLKGYIISVLRRAWMRSAQRTIALAKGRIKRGVYKCAHCIKLFKRGEINVDHIEEVVKAGGFEGFDIFIERLFCDADNLQILCKKCHSIKTEKNR